MFVLKLPHFFTRLHGEEKSTRISKLTYPLTPLSRSYIVFALEARQCISYFDKYIFIFRCRPLKCRFPEDTQNGMVEFSGLHVGSMAR